MLCLLELLGWGIIIGIINLCDKISTKQKCRELDRYLARQQNKKGR